MTRERLESFIGKQVVMYLKNDNKVYVGELIKGFGIGNEMYLTGKKKWYYLKGGTLTFRLSHVRRIKEC